VQGWDIAPEQLQICRSSLDGSEVLLGSGQFGKVPFCCCSQPTNDLQVVGKFATNTGVS